MNPGRKKGLTDGFVERERNQNILRNVYATWFIISDGIAGNLINFFGDKTMSPEEVAEKISVDTRNAIMER